MMCTSKFMVENATSKSSWSCHQTDCYTWGYTAVWKDSWIGSFWNSLWGNQYLTVKLLCSNIKGITCMCGIYTSQEVWYMIYTSDSNRPIRFEFITSHIVQIWWNRYTHVHVCILIFNMRNPFARVVWTWNFMKR